MYLQVKWVSCRQYIYGSCFCIHSASLCLLVGGFNPFNFKVIIDIYVPIAIFLIVWGFVDLFSSLVFLDYISPFNICCKAGQVVLNSLNFCLSEKLFISPSILNESLAGQCNLGCIFSPFSTLNISCHFLLACRVSDERTTVKRMEFPLYVTCCFSFAAFNILSLCLVFVSLISICLGMFLLGFILYGTLCASWTWLTTSFSMLGKFSTIISSKIFSYCFFFSSSSGTPITRMLVHLILSQRSLRLSSVLLILFTLFCSSEVISTILSSSSLIHSSSLDILEGINSRISKEEE